MEDKIETMIEIFTVAVSTLSLIAAIVGIFTVILPIIQAKKTSRRERQIFVNEKRIKEQLIQVEKIKSLIDMLGSKLCYILFSSSTADDEIIQYIKNMENYRAKNNLGLYYLNISRKEQNKDFEKISYLEKAIDYFEKAKQSCPENDINLATIYVNLADAYDDYNTNKDTAIDCCMKALIIDPQCSKAYNMLASIFMAQDNYELAKQNTDKALNCDLNNGYAYLTKFEILLKQPSFDKEEALDYLYNALKNGCPVWEYTGLPYYKTIISNPLWNEYENIINEYKKIYLISHTIIQQEHDYIL